jgi:hypothetical protein
MTMNSVLLVECVDMRECQPFEPPKSDDVTIQMCDYSSIRNQIYLYTLRL